MSISLYLLPYINTYISDFDSRVPADLGQESQASSCVEKWNSAFLSSRDGYLLSALSSLSESSLPWSLERRLQAMQLMMALISR